MIQGRGSRMVCAIGFGRPLGCRERDWLLFVWGWRLGCRRRGQILFVQRVSPFFLMRGVYDVGRICLIRRVNFAGRRFLVHGCQKGDESGLERDVGGGEVGRGREAIGGARLGDGLADGEQALEGLGEGFQFAERDGAGRGVGGVFGEAAQPGFEDELRLQAGRRDAGGAGDSGSRGGERVGL